jgi:hypothetical protein
MLVLGGYQEADGENGRNSASPPWTTRHVDSGTSSHAPWRSPKGSDTTRRASSESPCSRTLSGKWACKVEMSVLRNSDRETPSLEYRKAHVVSPSVVATVIWIGFSMPWRRPTSSMKPTAEATAAGWSCSRPNVSARKKKVSESVDPSISGYSPGSTARASSRFTTGKSLMSPLCIHSHRP